MIDAKGECGLCVRDELPVEFNASPATTGNTLISTNVTPIIRARRVPPVKTAPRICSSATRWVTKWRPHAPQWAWTQTILKQS